jgi:hypothetical protein
MFIIKYQIEEGDILVEIPYVDTAPAFEDEIIRKGEFMIHVRWNPYMSSHEADVFKVKSVGTKQSYALIGTGAGKSKKLALADAEMLIID